MATLPGARRPDVPGTAAVGAPAVDGEAVAARLRELGAAAKAPVEALEPALSAILEATGVTAAAVCLYDPRYELLRLAAEVGLSDEGCQRLRTVRRGGVAGWDMPLHSLLNRRAYLIGNAAQNRYVPALVDSAKPVRAVACLPLYSGSVPAGSLVLVTVAVRPFGEGEIRALEQPLRELGKLIEAVRRQASEAASARSAVSALAAEGDAEPPPDVPDAAGGSGGGGGARAAGPRAAGGGAGAGGVGRPARRGRGARGGPAYRGGPGG